MRLGVFQQSLVYAVDKRICFEFVESLSALAASIENPGSTSFIRGGFLTGALSKGRGRGCERLFSDDCPRSDAQCAVPSTVNELACFKFQTFRLIHRFTLQAAAAK